MTQGHSQELIQTQRDLQIERNVEMEQVGLTVVVDRAKAPEQSVWSLYAGLNGKVERLAGDGDNGLCQVTVRLDQYSSREIERRRMKLNAARDANTPLVINVPNALESALDLPSGVLSLIDSDLYLYVIDEVRCAMQDFRAKGHVIAARAISNYIAERGEGLPYSPAMVRRYIQALEPNLIFPD